MSFSVITFSSFGFGTQQETSGLVAQVLCTWGHDYTRFEIVNPGRNDLGHPACNRKSTGGQAASGTLRAIPLFSAGVRSPSRTSNMFRAATVRERSGNKRA